MAASAARQRVIELVIRPKVDGQATETANAKLSDTEKQAKQAEGAVVSLAKAFGYGGLAEQAGNASKAVGAAGTSLSTLALVAGGATLAVGILAVGIYKVGEGLIALGRAAVTAEKQLKTAVSTETTQSVHAMASAFDALDDAGNRVTVALGANFADSITTMVQSLTGAELAVEGLVSGLGRLSSTRVGLGSGQDDNSLAALLEFNGMSSSLSASDVFAWQRRNTSKMLGFSAGVATMNPAIAAGVSNELAGYESSAKAAESAMAAAKASLEFGKATLQVGKDAKDATKALDEASKQFVIYGPELVTPEARAAFQAKQATAYWESIFSVYNKALAAAALKSIPTAAEIEASLGRQFQTGLNADAVAKAFGGAVVEMSNGYQTFTPPAPISSTAGTVSSGIVGGATSIVNGVASGTGPGAVGGVLGAVASSNPWTGLIMAILQIAGHVTGLIEGIAKWLQELPKNLMKDIDQSIAKGIPAMAEGLLSLLTNLIPAIIGGTIAGVLDLIGAHKAADRILHPKRFANNRDRNRNDRLEEAWRDTVFESNSPLGFAIGGRVPVTGFHWLEEGEEVVPRDGTMSGAAASRTRGGGGGVTIQYHGPIYGVAPDEHIRDIARRLDQIRGSRGLGV